MAKANLNCPACGAGLRVAAFECPDCGIEVKGKFDFVHTPFDALSEKQVDFLMAFLKCQGNMSRVQNELQLSYPTAKKKLNEVLITLGLLANTTEKKEEIKVMDVNCWNVAENSQRASDVVKRKLKSCGGRAIVTSYSGKEYEVWAEADGKKFGSDALHGITHEYEIFDVVVDYLNTHKGWAKKGTGRAPLGSEKCGLDTVAGVILHDYFQVPVGGSGLDPSFLVVAVLEWAGIIRNCWGYVELTSDYFVPKEREE